MDEVSLADCLFAQGQNVEIVILAHCRIEVELALHIRLIHHLVIVFVADLFVYQGVPLVFLGVRADIASVLLTYSCEIKDLGLLLLGLCVTSRLAPTYLA